MADGLNREAAAARVQHVYYLLLWVWCWMQFGHGANMGVATTIGGAGGVGNGEAMALGSWVCIGACVGLPFSSTLLRSFRRDCVLLFGLGPCIVAAIGLMLWPGASLKFLYFARFTVGLIEAPMLPWITDWLNAYSSNWTLENTIVHAICPVAETVGFVLSQELQEDGMQWQVLFLLQMAMIILGLVALRIVGGKEYLSRSGETSLDRQFSREDDLREGSANFAAKPHWCVFWCVNLGLAFSLFSACGIKFCVKAFTQEVFGMNVHQLVLCYFVVSLVGPAGGAAVTTVLLADHIKPEDFRRHRQTLRYLALTSTLGAACGLATVWVAGQESIFVEMRTACFMIGLLISMGFGAMAFPAAQALINNSLGPSYAVWASSTQTLTTNVLANVPGPWLIGTLIDQRGAKTSFTVGVSSTSLTAVLMIAGMVAAHATKDRDDGFDSECLKESESQLELLGSGSD